MNDNDNIKQSSNQSYGIAGNTPKGENEENTQVQEKNSNLEMDRLFNYLEIKNSTEKFVIDDENPNIFENSIGKFNYVICVLLKDDTQRGNEMLEKTLDSIYQNLNALNEIGISSSNTLVCIFVNKITNYYLFNKDDVHNIKEDQNYYFYTTAQKEGYQSSTIYLFTKPKELLDLEALKCYYLYVISKIRMNKQQIFSSVITAGVELKPSGLKSLILSAYDTVKTHGVSVGLVDSNGIGIFSMIEQYERTHFNIYNMNYYGMSSAVPISSLLSTMYIDNNVLSILKKYYSLAHENQTIDYHDYNLGLNLYQNHINIKFYSKEVAGTLFTNELEYTDYREIWVNRYSGYYGNTFELIRELINMNNFNLFKKIILFFQLIGISIEFIYPSLSSMVIYSIFYEAFNTYDYRVATFFTMLYIFMLLASGMCSLVTKKPEEMKMTNMFIFFFMEVYYLFILICSVVAMNNVKKNTSNNEYKFNNAAISCIIVFTFLPYIVPMLLNIEKITSNLLNMLAYIGLGAPSSTSNLLMAQVWNASDTSGGKEIDERKSMALLFFFLFNLFFGSLTFYNYNRRKRVECVMGFGIFYLFYNFFKTIGIVMKILGSSDDANDPNKNGRVIDGIKNSLGKDDDNDMRSEEKKLNNVNYSNDYNNNSNDNNNNNNVENDDNDNGDY
jgi:hypothetical protein